VLSSMDYLLGRNALNQSYVTGWGEVSTLHQHNRWFSLSTSGNSPTGALAGGPNSTSSTWDPTMAGTFTKGCSPQMCYLDNVQAWSVNEVAINWNSALSWVASFVADQKDGAPLFVDMQPNAPFADAIEWLRTQGISTGSLQLDGTVIFDPTGPVRREAMAAFLYRAAGRPDFTAPATSPFLDVSTDSPFYKEIAWAASEGIADGTAVDGGFEFRPAESVTREAMAAFLYRAHGSPAFTPPVTSPFVDVAPSDPFYAEIAWLQARGISDGTDVGNGNREFRPTEPVRREAMAAFLFRANAI